jgi:hypothetical protein
MKSQLTNWGKEKMGQERTPYEPALSLWRGGLQATFLKLASCFCLRAVVVAPVANWAAFKHS